MQHLLINILVFGVKWKKKNHLRTVSNQIYTTRQEGWDCLWKSVYLLSGPVLTWNWRGASTRQLSVSCRQPKPSLSSVIRTGEEVMILENRLALMTDGTDTCSVNMQWM